MLLLRGYCIRMRLSVCFRIVRSRGFFLGRRLFFYKRRFLGYILPLGVGHWPRQWLADLTDGSWGWLTRIGRGGVGVRAKRGGVLSGHALRWQNASLILLRYLAPTLDHFWPLAWAVLRYLKVRHQRGLRYRLGLPAHGQRTHSNAATTRRGRGAIAGYLRTHFWFRKLWEPRKRVTQKIHTKHRMQSKRSAKAERHRRGVVRTKNVKKSDAWR